MILEIQPVLVLAAAAVLCCLIPFWKIKKLHPRITIWPTFFAWFAGGICFGIGLILVPKLKFSYEVSLAQILNIFLTLAVAFLFQYYLKQRTDSRKAEKDLVAAQIKAAIENLAVVRKTFLDCYEAKSIKHASLLTTQLRNLSNAINLVEVVVDAANLQQDGKLLKEITSLYIRYKKTLTGKPFPKTPYDAKQFKSEETICENLHRRLILFSLQVTNL